ncbi:hypothetical protein BASA81_012040 [Batrachochytrium salamandrivorans]|nr:hypothetical protein BASA81_012040 [Batrachochytrium salamandrivorans]
MTMLDQTQLPLPRTARPLRIGVLALQGAFSEHIHILSRMPLLVESAIAVRNCDQLLNSSLDALILPVFFSELYCLRI